jgi:hypothetical protein
LRNLNSRIDFKVKQSKREINLIEKPCKPNKIKLWQTVEERFISYLWYAVPPIPLLNAYSRLIINKHRGISVNTVNSIVNARLQVKT